MCRVNKSFFISTKILLNAHAILSFAKIRGKNYISVNSSNLRKLRLTVACKFSLGYEVLNLTSFQISFMALYLTALNHKQFHLSKTRDRNFNSNQVLKHWIQRSYFSWKKITTFFLKERHQLLIQKPKICNNDWQF